MYILLHIHMFFIPEFSDLHLRTFKNDSSGLTRAVFGPPSLPAKTKQQNLPPWALKRLRQGRACIGVLNIWCGFGLCFLMPFGK